MSYLDQQFNLRDTVADLSPAVKQAIGEIDVVSIVWEIGDQFKLLLSEIGDVCEETKKVIAGETRPENFVDNVHNKLGDENKSKAVAVATEINNKILIPIRDAFKKATMGKLVPDPQPTTHNQQPTAEEGKNLSSTSYQLQATSYLGDEHGPYGKEHLLREIENPTPSEISTYNLRPTTDNLIEKKGTGVPENLPIGSETAEETRRNGSVIRTMPNDLRSLTNNQRPTTNDRQQITEKNESVSPTSYKLQATSYPSYSRGKFGHGTPPKIGVVARQFSAEIRSTKPLPAEASAQAGEIRNNEQFPKDTENQNGVPQPISNIKPVRTEIRPGGYPVSGAGSPSFIPPKPGAVGGTIIGGNQQPTTYDQQQGGQKTTTNYQQPERQKLTTGLQSTIEKPPVPPAPAKPPAPPAPSQPMTNDQRPTTTENTSVSSYTAEAEPPKPIPNAPTGAIPSGTQRTTFQIPEKVETVDDVVADKLTKTVNVPSERKHYVVDPYREPIE